MQTRIADRFQGSTEAAEAEAILRSCVHCGFCNATCPTYLLLGDERDGPRGRIYLMKQMLEGEPVSGQTRTHLDRCLTCRSCETTCPSGVRYGQLIDIGRAVAERTAPRPMAERAMRWVLSEGLRRPRLFGAALTLGRALRPLLPRRLAEHMPPRSIPRRWPAPRHARRMLVLAGCVQPALMPSVNAAAAAVLDALGISLIEARGAGCCGALRFHLTDPHGGRDDMRALIDAWWPYIEAGEIEAIVMTASGCGATVSEYGRLLAQDPAYAHKAARVAGLVRDLSQVLHAELPQLEPLLARPNSVPVRIAYHPPCSLQHAQRIRGLAEALLRAAGFELLPVANSHLCCGSAGTYSLLQPGLSGRLRDNRIAALQAGGPQALASANVGCIAHLAQGAQVPVKHWVEWLAVALNA